MFSGAQLINQLPGFWISSSLRNCDIIFYKPKHCRFKHCRVLAFWLSLCFWSFLLFLVCHDTAFLFSTRAMTALGWLSNAHRDDNLGDTGDRVIHRGLTHDFNQFLCFLCLCKKNQEMLHNLFSVNFLSPPNSIQHSISIFFLEFLILGIMYTQLAGDVTRRESLLFSHTKSSYLGEHSEVSQAR